MRCGNRSGRESSRLLTRTLTTTTRPAIATCLSLISDYLICKIHVSHLTRSELIQNKNSKCLCRKHILRPFLSKTSASTSDLLVVVAFQYTCVGQTTVGACREEGEALLLPLETVAGGGRQATACSSERMADCLSAQALVNDRKSLSDMPHAYQGSSKCVHLVEVHLTHHLAS